MKKYTLFAAAMIIAATANAEVYNYVTIKQADKTISLPIGDIESITFTVDDETTEIETPDYELRVLTFEDADYLGGPNFVDQTNWSSLIDSPQYGGPLLYGDYEGTLYYWYDQNNTELFAMIDPDDMGNVYWSGGEAISNYVAADYLTTEISYMQQLATPNGGYNGSANFCVHNGYFDDVFYNKPSGGIWFMDEEARIIDHMYVSLTSYQLSQGLIGSTANPAAGPTDWVKFVAIGTDAQGNTKEVELTMCENGQFVEGWQKWDLSELGEIVRLDFNITSSLMGSWGMYFPGYIAYDNIAVRFPIELPTK